MKSKKITRLLALLLCMIMVASVFTAVIPAHASSNVIVQNGTGTRSAIQVTGTYSYRAYLNGSFNGFAFAMPTWNTTNARATLYLYKWQGSYSATIASTPIASKTFNPLSDNAYHWVEFAEQPAGDYLFHIANISGKAGVWTNTGTSNSMGHMYLNGTEQSYQPDLKVSFTDSANASFGYCKTLTAQLPYTASGSLGAVKMDSPMGVRVKTTAPFVGMITKLATYTATDIDADLSVYAWKGTYAATVAAEPVASQRMRLKDNANHEIRFNELPAGEYLFLVENYTKAPGMYAYSGASNFKGYVYKDCYPWTGNTQYPLIYVVFNEERGSYYTNCSAVGDVISGTYTPPAEYVIPSDSLIYTHEVMPDTWVFTDGLGRTSLTNATVGDPRNGKTLAMFYWDWHIDSFTNQNPVNLQKLSEKYPESTMRDWDNALWGTLGSTTFWWNESIYGFYRSDDRWVLRKQAELLANAGVDVVFTDNTNAEHTWSNAYIPLMEEWTDAMNDGLKAPKVSFMLPFAKSNTTDDESYTNTQLRSIYLNVYRSGRFQNLWFYWKGKPMVMGQQGAFCTGTALDNEIKNFFTFRTGHSSYTGGSTNGSTWGWCSMFPQGLHGNGSTTEQITVGVAMNYDYVHGMLSAMNGRIVAGRSYTSKGYHTEANASKYGYNFAEQFNYAIAVDPSVIFVTGWNEFRVGRYNNWPYAGAASCTESAFPDQYNDEFSRDIEPTKGALADHYYYQLVNFVRRYKGARPIPTPSGSATIDLNGSIDQWKNVEPYYAAYIDNVEDRDAAGYGTHHYTETSGRNDIIGAQVARDSEFVYFLVECRENITPYTDSLWMNLYIDSNQSNQGWNTFEYVVNKSAASAGTLVLEKFTTANSYATTKVADVAYKVDGRYMTVKIPKSALGLSGNNFTINFTWTDNVHDEGDYSKFSGDIMDFYISGDVAPGGRFKYSYVSTNANAGTAESDDNTYEYVEETISTGTRTGTAYNSASKKKMGQHLNIGEKILKNITIDNLATYADGNVNSWSLKVWQWKGSYAATVAGAPLYTTSGHNHKDCQDLSVDIPVSMNITGDIYYELSYLSGSGSFTGWKASGKLPTGLQTFINGTQVVDSYTSVFTVVEKVPVTQPEPEVPVVPDVPVEPETEAPTEPETEAPVVPDPEPEVPVEPETPVEPEPETPAGPVYTDHTITVGVRGNGGAYNNTSVKKFGQRYDIGDNILKNITIKNLATYADGNVNTWSFKVWQWKGSYAATVASTPLFTKTGKNHADNANFSVDISADLGITGEIFYEIQYLSGKGAFTGWSATGSIPEGIRTYVGGSLKSGTYVSAFTVTTTEASLVTPSYKDQALTMGVRGNGGAYNNNSVKKFGQRYNIGDKALKKITVNSMATYADGNSNGWTLKVWQWQGSYAATVASTPLYSTSGKNHADCTNFSVSIPTGLAIMGDIYYEIQYTSGSGAFTGWTAAASVTSGVQTYVGGTLKSGTYASTLTVIAAE